MSQTRTRKGKGIKARPAGTGDSDERGRVEEALRQERGRAQQYLDVAGVIIVAIDRHERVSLVNRKGCEVLGYEARDIIGKNWLDTFLPSIVREEVRAIFSQLMSGDVVPAEYFENPVVTKSGEERTIAWHNALLRDEAGSICGTLSSGEDITERRRTEEALRKANRARRVLSGCSQAIVRATEESELLHEICRIIVEDGGYRLAWVGFAENDQAKTVRPVARAGYEEGYLETVAITWADTERGRGPTGGAIRTGTPCGARHILTDPAYEPWRAEATARGYASSLAVPLLWSGEAWGAVNVYAPEPDAFAAEEVDLLAELADCLAHGIMALRMRDERTRAEEGLRESEERFRRLAEDSIDGIVLVEGLEVRFANPALVKMLGYESDKDIVGRPFTDLVSPEHRELMLERGRARDEGREVPARYDFKALRKDGSEFEGEISVSDVRYGGKQARQGVIRDVTERKLAEEALRASESRYRLLADNVTDLIWTTDLKLHPTHASPSISRLLGYTVEEAMALRLKDILAPASLDLVKKMYAEEISSKSLGQEDPHRSRRMELEVVRKDGSMIWVEADMTFLRDPNGRAVGVLGVSRDVTERKRADEALRESESRYRLLAENVTDIIWTADLNLNLTYISPSAERLWGYTVEERMAMRLQDLLTPASLEVARRAYADAMARRARNENVPGSPVTLELEFHRKDGSTGWGEVTVAFLRDADGQPTGILGVSREITERKREEEALRESESRYRLLAENATDVIWTTDMDLNLTYVSPSVEQTWGYTAEERMGMRLEAVLAPTSLEVAKSAFRETLASAKKGGRGLSEPRTVEMEIRRKDGSTARAEVKVGVLRDPDGRPMGLRGASRDITERKRAEEALRESEELLRASLDNMLDCFGIYSAIRDESGRIVDFRIEYVNDAACANNRMTREEQTGERLLQLLPAHREGGLFDEYCKLVETGTRMEKVSQFYEDVYGEQRLSRAFDIRCAKLGDGFVAAWRDVTDLVRAQEALRESEEKFRLLAETSPTGIFVYRGTRYVYVSPVFEALTGYTREELLAMDIWDVAHPELRDLGRERALARQRGEDVPSRYEVKLLTKRGKECWADFTAALIEFEGEPAVIGTIHDITERKHAEEALSESEERFRSLADAAFEGAAIHHKGTILEANRALAAMFGYEPSEVIGMHALDFAAPESREVLLRNIVSKNESPFELIGLRKDGSTFPVEVCGRAIPYRGRTATVAALRDLTERKQAEEALQKARDELENRVEREMQRGSSYGLTFRELTVLHLVAAGKADKEIAFELGISPLTASKHVTNILGKMNAASRTEAGVRALREGLLD